MICHYSANAVNNKPLTKTQAATPTTTDLITFILIQHDKRSLSGTSEPRYSSQRRVHNHIDHKYTKIPIRTSKLATTAISSITNIQHLSAHLLPQSLKHCQRHTLHHTFATLVAVQKFQAFIPYSVQKNTSSQTTLRTPP